MSVTSPLLILAGSFFRGLPRGPPMLLDGYDVISCRERYAFFIGYLGKLPQASDIPSICPSWKPGRASTIVPMLSGITLLGGVFFPVVRQVSRRHSPLM